ncbi:MAG: flagellar motor switch protein FliN [Marinomonas sp.]|uniref:flagellar motor switch protein FliN n=1 Tax=Marinomonas communis TaxID=28254 RepID=UPI0010045A65|nr:flagellar motor switch protein FliN [Marinomonas communis]MCC4274610.1 flagellar motor switch protein FliN [Marinomonas communis]RUM49515.1 MAG: flagellar motor switch protein FliN [Marinomonas sp.]RUM56023.1 MAG: flagellar motor switch protein FliN [Marinomonas sp.]|tara:strand:- start:666 stop:1130 length:465 start_codon:yes stop_codon:yes gene_type:complete
MAEETNPDAEGMDEDLADEWAAAMSEAGESESGESGEGLDDEWAAAMSEQDVKPVQLDQLGSSTGGALSSDMDLIMDIPVTLSMELGNTEIAIRNLLQLTQGSVVELDRFAGEPLDVLVNGTLIAHGEVVVVNDKYGIRLTDVVSPSERIKRLK